MVEKGELTVEQGKVLNEELKHNIKKTVKETTEKTDKAVSDSDISDLLSRMTPEQIAALKEQLSEKAAGEDKDRMSTIEPIEYNSRLREITAVLRKHNITRGVTPKKLRAILEDLGRRLSNWGRSCPWHSDILRSGTVMS